MWDERYAVDEYVYGTRENDFLAQNVAELPKGNILSLAEGEGRNAVFLASQGYQVTAVDASLVGLSKAKKLAQKMKVEIEFIHADLTTFELGENRWDGVVSVFCPLPAEVRKAVHAKLIKGLKEEGVLLLEAYRPEQVDFGTGGGNDIGMMQTKASITEELGLLEFKHLAEFERNVVEGIFHTGMAAVVQAIGVKSTVSRMRT